MRVPSLLFLSLSGAIALMGFGCKKPDLARPTPIIANFPTSPAPKPYVHKVTPDKTVAPEIISLRQTLLNLANATAYHGTVVATAGTTLRGELFFAKTKGVHGILALSPTLNSEVYLKDDTVYFRASTSSWQNLSSLPEGQQIRDQMKEVFSVDKNGQPYLILSDGARYLDQKQDSTGCRDFHIQQTFYVPNTFTQDIHICVLNTYPSRITTTTPQGNLTATFDRFNDDAILSSSPLNEPLTK